MVDSPAKPAVTLTGTSKLSASNGVRVVGTVSVASTASISPNPSTLVTAVADPLSGLAVPGVGGRAAAITLKSGSQTINPGIYSQINVSGTGTSLKLNPGLYVISGGGLSVTGSSSISGIGVMIYNAGSTYPTAGGTYGGITLSTTGNVNLSAPSTGPYAGVLFFQARTDPTVFSITENSAMTLSGVIYASDAAPFTASGTTGRHGIDDAVVVNRLQMSGSAVADALPAPLVASSIASSALTWEDATDLIMAAPWAGTWSESALDELVANLLAPQNQEAYQADLAENRPQYRVTAGRPLPGRSPSGGVSLAVPEGPISSLERPRQAGSRAARLVDRYNGSRVAPPLT